MSEEFTEFQIKSPIAITKEMFADDNAERLGVSQDSLKAFAAAWNAKIERQAFTGIDWGVGDSIGITSFGFVPPRESGHTATIGRDIREAILSLPQEPSIIVTTHRILEAIKADLKSDGVKREITPDGWCDATRIDGLQVRSFGTQQEVVDAERELGERALAIQIYRTRDGRVIQ